MRDYKNVVLMRFTGLPDLNGNVYAKDCKITFPERLDIKESYLQDSKVVGKAFNFKKENDQLLFDATIDDTGMAYNLLSKKKPGAGVTCDPSTITGITHVAELDTIALIDLHADPIIEPFSKYEIKEV
jgi:hypothetical protein